MNIVDAIGEIAVAALIARGLERFLDLCRDLLKTRFDGGKLLRRRAADIREILTRYRPLLAEALGEFGDLRSIRSTGSGRAMAAESRSRISRVCAWI